MAARQLPVPALISEELDIVSSRIDQRSATGSNLQRGSRAGSHYIGSFITEPLTPAAAKEWLDLRNEADTVIMDLSQPGLDVGEVGTVQVNGTGWAGSNIGVKGLPAYYPVAKGQAFTHLGSDFTHRTYVAAAAVTANSSGVAIIPLETMLTWPPLNNDALYFNPPRLEGFATVERGSWLQDGNGYQTIRFTIEERG